MRTKTKNEKTNFDWMMKLKANTSLIKGQIK